MIIAKAFIFSSFNIAVNVLFLINFFLYSVELADLIMLTRPFLQQISKAKAGRLVRTLVDLFLDLEAGTGREIDLIKECIEWAGNERRTFLKQALEARLMGLYADNDRYEESLQLGIFLNTSQRPTTLFVRLAVRYDIVYLSFEFMLCNKVRVASVTAISLEFCSNSSEFVLSSIINLFIALIRIFYPALVKY